MEKLSRRMEILSRRILFFGEGTRGGIFFMKKNALTKKQEKWEIKTRQDHCRITSAQWQLCIRD